MDFKYKNLTYGADLTSSDGLISNALDDYGYNKSYVPSDRVNQVLVNISKMMRDKRYGFIVARNYLLNDIRPDKEDSNDPLSASGVLSLQESDVPETSVEVNPLEFSEFRDMRMPSSFSHSSDANDDNSDNFDSEARYLTQGYSIHDALVYLDSFKQSKTKELYKKEVDNRLGAYLLHKYESDDAVEYSGAIVLVNYRDNDWCLGVLVGNQLSVFTFVNMSFLMSNMFIRTVDDKLKEHRNPKGGEMDAFDNLVSMKAKEAPTKVKQRDFEEPVTENDLYDSRAVFNKYF